MPKLGLLCHFPYIFYQNTIGNFFKSENLGLPSHSGSKWPVGGHRRQSQQSPQRGELRPVALSYFYQKPLKSMPGCPPLGPQCALYNLVPYSAFVFTLRPILILQGHFFKFWRGHTISQNFWRGHKISQKVWRGQNISGEV